MPRSLTLVRHKALSSLSRTTCVDLPKEGRIKLTEICNEAFTYSRLHMFVKVSQTYEIDRDVTLTRVKIVFILLSVQACTDHVKNVYILRQRRK